MDGLIFTAARDLASKRQYIENMRGYADLALLGLTCKALQAVHAGFGDGEFTKLLERHDDEWDAYRQRWLRLTKLCFEFIAHVYRKRAKAFKRAERRRTDLCEFFQERRTCTCDFIGQCSEEYSVRFTRCNCSVNPDDYRLFPNWEFQLALFPIRE